MVAVVAVGCGGNVVVDGSDTSATSGSTSSGTTSSGSSGAQANSLSCLYFEATGYSTGHSCQTTVGPGALAAGCNNQSATVVSGCPLSGAVGSCTTIAEPNSNGITSETEYYYADSGSWGAEETACGAANGTWTTY
jgi:hypothetical protein